MGRIGQFRKAYRERRGFRWAVDLFVLAVFFFVATTWQTRHHVRGEPLPVSSLTTLDGQSVSLQSFAGRPTLVALWAPWCGVCKADSDNVSRVMRWAGARANVVSIALEYSDRASVERYVQERGVDYPVLLGNAALGQSLHVDSFPTLYFVGADGRISGSAVGYTTTLGMLWRLLWA